jgi:hypothetical protein
MTRRVGGSIKIWIFASRERGMETMVREIWRGLMARYLSPVLSRQMEDILYRIDAMPTLIKLLYIDVS